MIKYFLFGNGTQIVPLYVFSNSKITEDREKLRTYLESAPVKIPVTQEMYRSLNVSDLTEIDPAVIGLVAATIPEIAAMTNLA